MTKRRMHPVCFTCLVKKQQEACGRLIDADAGTEYMRSICGVLAKYGNTDSPSLLLHRMTELGKAAGYTDDYFAQEKKRFNALMLGVYDALLEHAMQAEDPLLCALQLSMTGNYIDSGTVDNIDKDALMNMLYDFKRLGCGMEEYPGFKLRLEKCSRLTVLHDNCGEVVLDKLLITVIKKLYPHIQVTSVVRGEPVLNDVTPKEAKEIGLNDISNVVDSGTDIAGCELDWLSKPAHDAVYNADLIISKGQGNFETLCGCGLPVYYLFLCKCPLQCRRFNVAPLTGMFYCENGESLFDKVN